MARVFDSLTVRALGVDFRVECEVEETPAGDRVGVWRVHAIACATQAAAAAIDAVLGEETRARIAQAINHFIRDLTPSSPSGSAAQRAQFARLSMAFGTLRAPSSELIAAISERLIAQDAGMEG